MNNTTIVFIHIPKTAGMTVNSILDSQYQSNNFYEIDYKNIPGSFQNLLKLIRNNEKYDLVRGHFLYGIDREVDNNVTYFTFFRNPFLLFKSYYRYIRNTPGNQHYAYVSEMDLFEFLEYTRVVGLDNLMTRHLTHKGVFVDEKKQPIIVADYLNDISVITENDLSEAIDNVSQKNFIPLIVEDFDRSILLAKRIFDWKNFPYYVIKNKTGRPFRNADKRELIEKFNLVNRFDIKLYEKAMHLFNNYCADYPGIEDEIKTFRMRLKTRNVFSIFFR